MYTEPCTVLSKTQSGIRNLPREHTHLFGMRCHSYILVGIIYLEFELMYVDIVISNVFNLIGKNEVPFNMAIRNGELKHQCFPKHWNSKNEVK